MNSRVKQAQKEGATVGDIAAGLSYSVIKNALFKVIKLRDPKEIGSQVIVQGGTFMSDATLRAFEQLTGVHAVRPDIAGCMGAYGAALLARDRAGADGTSTILSAEDIAHLTVTQKHVRCGRCSNNCQLTVNDFGGGRRFITGNRCEKGAGHKKQKTEAPNLFKKKNELLFNREVLSPDEAPRGTVGIPRALNMYENYPFWHAFFTRLGFSVQLSDQSSKKTYQAGIESMPSESVCYPAKMSHGHVMNLIDRDVDFIWMPCVRWERKEDPTAGNCYNCPIVMSYPTALALNIDEIREQNIEFLYPFVPYHDKTELKRVCTRCSPSTVWPMLRPVAVACVDPRSRAPRSMPPSTLPLRPMRASTRISRPWARRLLSGSRTTAATASYSPAAPTITTPRSTTPCPSLSRALALRSLPRIRLRTW